MWKTHSHKVLPILKFTSTKDVLPIRFTNTKDVLPISFTSTKDVLQCQKCLAIPRELLKQTQIDVIIMHTNREGPICVLGKYDDLLT